MYTFFLLVTTGWCVSALAKSVFYYDPENAHIHFEEFITKYNKEYTGENEKEARLEIFKKNLEKINRMNERSDHAEYGITKFMDLSHEEFIGSYTGIDVGRFRHCDVIKTDKDIPDWGAVDFFDWRDKGVVTPVKEQGRCRSSYIFSAIGHLESQYLLHKKQSLQNFSVQQILDCDIYDHGCGGGAMSNVFRTLVKLEGPMKESDYPYKGAVKECKSDKSKVIPKVQSCISYNLTRLESVRQLLYKVGPIPIGINADALFAYTKGIISDLDCSGPLNHGALLVGYSMDRDTPYWIVKNSWGTDFGEKGYFRLHRDGFIGPLSCGMLNDLIATAVLAK